MKCNQENLQTERNHTAQEKQFGHDNIFFTGILINVVFEHPIV